MNAEDSHDATAIVQADRAGETPGAAPGPIVRVAAPARQRRGESPGLGRGLHRRGREGARHRRRLRLRQDHYRLGPARSAQARGDRHRHGRVAGVDVLHCTPGEVPAAYLPQHPAAVLNPVRRIGGVLADIANARRPIGGSRSSRTPLDTAACRASRTPVATATACRRTPRTQLSEPPTARSPAPRPADGSPTRCAAWVWPTRRSCAVSRTSSPAASSSGSCSPRRSCARLSSSSRTSRPPARTPCTATRSPPNCGSRPPTA